MSTTEIRPAFRRRLRGVARQIWSLHVLRGVALTSIVAAALLAVVAAADYVYELSWLARLGILTACVAFLAVLATRWIIRPALSWNRTRVAAELEGLFPRLGQRLRTADQHGGRPHEELLRDGVDPGLVAALEKETEQQVRPLPLHAAIPVSRALETTVAALCCLAAVAAFVAWNPEWRTAVRRVALSPDPYTTLTAAASRDTVDEGTDVEIRATMSGRDRAEVVLHVREIGDPHWRRETMTPSEAGFTVGLPKLRFTTEYFVAAGPERTPTQQIIVRHPLKITTTQAVVTAPEYTGMSPVTYDTGSFSAVQGSSARIRFEFDRSPVAATLVLTDPTEPTAPERRIALNVQDRSATAELSLTSDIAYTIEAQDTEGMPLVANRHRIRVTADRPPTVWFDEPRESMEVHTLAEVLLRARARDDFGVTTLGIVFQINNEEERTLILKDVAETHQREVTAEDLIMLEYYLLTQKDCVAYYAFAEDNYSELPHQATTDLRFIDIRPFKRNYRLIDPADNPGGSGRDLIFLDEVIARQRFNLNQTMRLETRSKVRIDLTQLERVATFENKLAGQTHELADFLASLGVDGTVILADAEEMMLSAVDSLNGAKFEIAISQERDALRFLMEARDTVDRALQKQPRNLRAQVRTFDRLQRQKLRRENQQAETLTEIASELGQLASEEGGVARDLEAMQETDPDKGSDEDPLLERQDEIAGGAAAIDKVAATAEGLTGLARKRITDAAQAANAGADAFMRKDRAEAREEVERAEGLFKLAADQVRALAAQEAAQRIAAARELANNIALQTAPSDTDTKGGGGGGGEDDMAGLGNAAEQTRTLKDVMEQIAGSGSDEDAEAARKIGGLMKEEDLENAIERLERPGAGDDRAERQDLSERFAALGQKLDQAYRETVAPRLEELAKLEREAYELEQRAGAVGDPADFRRLRSRSAALIERLDEARLSDLVSKELREGVSSPNASESLDVLGQGLSFTHSQLVSKLQEFVAGDRLSTDDETVPPEYRDLVDRYLRVLSAGNSK